jgi:hypothetical protein
MTNIVSVSSFNKQDFIYNPNTKRISYGGVSCIFVTNPMLCIGVPVHDTVKQVSFSTLKLKCDSTSPEKTEQNRKFFSSIDLIMSKQTDIEKPYSPILRQDGTMRLKIVHCDSVKIIDREQNTTTIESIAPNETYCKFIIEIVKQIERDSSRSLGTWVHHILLKKTENLLDEEDENNNETHDNNTSNEDENESSNDEEESEDESSNTAESNSGSDEESDNESSASIYSKSASSTSHISSVIQKKNAKSAHKPKLKKT